MSRNYFKFILLFISFICKTFSNPTNKGFTIDTEGKNVVTTKITDQGEFYAIAFTEIGTLIKYKSDTSIITTKKFPEFGTNSGYTKSFICQYSTNKLVLTRDKKIYEITLSSTGDDTLTQISPDSQEIISYLHCNYNQNKYIYTYLRSDSKAYHFKVNDKSLVTSSSISDTILSSSCILLDSSLVLCINIIAGTKKLLYYYHNSGSSSVLKSGEININDNNDIYEIKGSLIKYYSQSEILFCISAKKELISDISLICSMLNAIISSRTLTIKSVEKFSSLLKIERDINYCQIEQLSNYNYATICLSYYYRTTYLLSLFQFDTSNNKFKFLNINSNDYEDISFSLLKNSPISIIVFPENTLGIFYQDIDKDSMILVFYPKCGKVFDLASLENNNNCDSLSNPTYSTHYYDECTHSFLRKTNIDSAYNIYEKNQFCKIKRIECKTDNVILDNFVDGYYKCRNINVPIGGYYFDNGENKFQKCDKSCLSCKGPTNVIDNNNYCQTCNDLNGYYLFPSSINPSKCMHKDEPIDKYYFETNQFKPCSPECLSCTESPTDTIISPNYDSSKDTKCKKCDTAQNFFPQVDKTSNCIKKDGNKIKYYYFNSDYQRWEKCTDGCLYCDEYGTSIDDTRCKKDNNELCDTNKGYYPLEDDNSAVAL